MTRPRRDPRVFDSEGREVFITLTCPHCHRTKPLRGFGLRRMDDGKVRSCSWCRACRSNPGVPIRIVVLRPGEVPPA